MWFRSRHKKVMVIGLDCADPDLVFGRWLHDLPNLKALVTAGVHGSLRSVTPPITVPAWACMMTGRDPGELGLYGFRNRDDYSYTGLSVATSAKIREAAVWDYLTEAGKTSIVVGVPPTYPPKPIKGDVVSCFLTPSGPDTRYTFPASLENEIRQEVGEYLVDVPGFRTDRKEWLLERIYEMTEKRFRLARYLLNRRPWDFFVMVEMGIDRIHHGFWQYMDAEHVLHEKDSPFRDAIFDYYMYVDREIGTILEYADDDTLVLVVSDHGAKRMDGAIALNEWLVEKGYLVLNTYPDRPVAFSELDVDWSRTRAWGSGGYYGRISINVRGREPEGVVPMSEYEVFRDRLIEEIEALGDPDGRPIGTRVVRPEDVYATVKNIPSDLLVFFGDLYWRSSGSVGGGGIHTRENDTGPDGANHDWDGIFIMATGRELRSAGSPAPSPVQGLELLDVAPTILNHFGRMPPSLNRAPVQTRS